MKNRLSLIVFGFLRKAARRRFRERGANFVGDVTLEPLRIADEFPNSRRFFRRRVAPVAPDDEDERRRGNFKRCRKSPIFRRFKVDVAEFEAFRARFVAKFVANCFENVSRDSAAVGATGRPMKINGADVTVGAFCVCVDAETGGEVLRGPIIGNAFEIGRLRFRRARR